MEVFSASQSQVAAGSRRCKDAGCDIDQDWHVVLRVNLLDSCEDPSRSPARLDRMLSCKEFSKSPVMPASYRICSRLAFVGDRDNIHFRKMHRGHQVD